MAPSRSCPAVLATVLVGAMLAAACTSGGESATTPMRPVAPSAPPTVEELLAAAVDATEALQAEYPDLRVVNNIPYERLVLENPDRPHRSPYEPHGFVAGTGVFATHAASRTFEYEVSLLLYVFDSPNEAYDFLDGYEQLFYVDEPVEVPGWAETAKFEEVSGAYRISYLFSHGPAVVWLRLNAIEFESQAAAGAELGTALDLVQASLDETVPIPAEMASPSAPTAEPTTEPTTEALLESAVDAAEELQAEYPRLSILRIHEYDSFRPDHPEKDVYQQHGFIEGAEVQMSTEADVSIDLHLDVFPSQDEAHAFRNDFAEQYNLGEPVELPGRPEAADFQVRNDTHVIRYSFVHGPAVVSLQLQIFEPDSQEAAGAELGTALDLVQASLDETVPIPG